MPQVTISGQKFDVPAPFAEGHTLTANEASALNQVFSENIRNNKAKYVKEGMEANVGLEALQAAISEYAASYQFGVRLPSGGSSAVRGDPVESEARSLAKQIIASKLRAAGRKISDVDADKLGAAIEALLDKDTSIRELARKRVEEKKSLADASLDDLDLGPATTSSTDETATDEAPATKSRKRKAA